MAQTKADKIYSNLTAGLITEAGPLNFPEGASSDEVNMLPTPTKSRVRRYGMDYELDSVLTSLSITDAALLNGSVSKFEWRTVAGSGSTNFLVLQIGSVLYFYDLASQPLSQGQKAFTVNMASFSLTGGDVSTTPVQMGSGEGYLFVTSELIKPFYVKYDSDLDSITSTEIIIQIRDFEGVEDNMEPDEELTTLSDEHKYNLMNQGWVVPATGGVEPIAKYKSVTGEYPPNSKQWWSSKDTSDNFDPAELQKLFTGNALAPKGHFLLNVLDKKRTFVSGVPNIPDVISTKGPTAVTFFAARAWYVFGNTLYFSQTIERENQIGKCYQEQDPTAEILNEPVDTDGGTIIIPDMGLGKALFVSGNSIIVYADNGTWSVSGSIGSGFTPTDLVVDKVSDIGILSPASLVDVEGTPLWWTTSGIYTVVRSDTTDRLQAQSITESTIKTYFETEIPELSKEYVSGDYDTLSKRIIWCWKSTEETTNRHKYDRLLVLDMTTGGFYPQTISELDTESPWIAGVFSTTAVTRVRATYGVVDNSGNTLTSTAGNIVTVDRDAPNTGQSQTKFLAFEPELATGLNEFTFAALNNTSYKDWETKDSVGKDAPAHIETGDVTEGDLTGRKQINYLYLYLESTPEPSCRVQTKWDWSNSGNSGRWSRKREAYRNVRDNHDVVIAKLKARGYGKGLRYRFESSEGKGLQIAGWATSYGVTTNN